MFVAVQPFWNHISQESMHQPVFGSVTMRFPADSRALFFFVCVLLVISYLEVGKVNPTHKGTFHPSLVFTGWER